MIEKVLLNFLGTCQTERLKLFSVLTLKLNSFHFQIDKLKINTLKDQPLNSEVGQPLESANPWILLKSFAFVIKFSSNLDFHQTFLPGKWHLVSVRWCETGTIVALVVIIIFHVMEVPVTRHFGTDLASLHHKSSRFERPDCHTYTKLFFWMFQNILSWYNGSKN